MKIFRILDELSMWGKFGVAFVVAVVLLLVVLQLT